LDKIIIENRRDRQAMSNNNLNLTFNYVEFNTFAP